MEYNIKHLGSVMAGYLVGGPLQDIEQICRDVPKIDGRFDRDTREFLTLHTQLCMILKRTINCFDLRDFFLDSGESAVDMLCESLINNLTYLYDLGVTRFIVDDNFSNVFAQTFFNAITVH